MKIDPLLQASQVSDRQDAAGSLLMALIVGHSAGRRGCNRVPRQVRRFGCERVDPPCAGSQTLSPQLHGESARAISRDYDVRVLGIGGLITRSCDGK